jgi:signal transduction histidine kinase
LALSIAVLFAGGCNGNGERITPRAKRGVLDLRAWDFRQDGTVALNGEWVLYADTLLKVERGSIQPPRCPRRYIHVPGRWRESTHSSLGETGKGRATYRLTVLCPDSLPTLGLRLKQVASAYKVYADGVLLTKVGTIGTDYQSHEPDFHPRVVPVFVSGDTLDIVIALGVFYHSLGGLWPAITLGAIDDIIREREGSVVYEAAVAGCFALFALYYGVLYLFRQRDRRYLYISLTCLGWVLCLLIVWEYILRILLPSFPFAVYRAVFSTYGFAMTVPYVFFVNAMYPRYATRLLVNSYITWAVVFSIVTWCFPRLALSDGCFLAGQIVGYFFGAWLVIGLIRAALDKQGGAWLILSSFLFGMLHMYDVFRLMNGTLSFPLTPFAGLGGLACWATALAAEQSKSQTSLVEHRERLLHAERLATIGTITAGIGHEVNNPNNALLLSLQSQKQVWEELVPVLDAHARVHGDFEVGGYRYSEIKEEMPSSMLRAVKNSERIRNIVRELRVLARRDEGAMDEEVAINAVVERSLSLVGNLIRKRTRNLRVEPGNNIPPFRGNNQRMEQVLINLLQNAAQSLESTEQAIVVTSSYEKQGRHIVMSVKDEGKGIDPEHLGHIFDPFFTTKTSGEGTGLGLSICKRIVEAHGGIIAISSGPGRGTDIVIRIPANGAEAVRKGY